MDDETKKLLETQFGQMVADAASFSEVRMLLNNRTSVYGGFLFQVDIDWAFVDTAVSGNGIRPKDRGLTAAQAFERALDFLLAKVASGEQPKRKNDETEE
jgi:hypothetical protein